MARAQENPPSPIDEYAATSPVNSDAAPPLPPPPPPPQQAAQHAYSPYGPYPYGQPSPRTNILAIISLVASGIGLFTFVPAIAGIVLGHIARSQIKRTGEAGDGLALAGLVIGYCVVGLYVLLVIGYIIFFVVIIGIATSTTSDLNPNDLG